MAEIEVDPNAFHQWLIGQGGRLFSLNDPVVDPAWNCQCPFATYLREVLDISVKVVRFDPRFPGWVETFIRHVDRRNFARCTARQAAVFMENVLAPRRTSWMTD